MILVFVFSPVGPKRDSWHSIASNLYFPSWQCQESLTRFLRWNWHWELKQLDERFHHYIELCECFEVCRSSPEEIKASLIINGFACDFEHQPCNVNDTAVCNGQMKSWVGRNPLRFIVGGKWCEPICPVYVCICIFIRCNMHIYSWIVSHSGTIALLHVYHEPCKLVYGIARIPMFLRVNHLQHGFTVVDAADPPALLLVPKGELPWAEWFLALRSAELLSESKGGCGCEWSAAMSC